METVELEQQLFDLWRVPPSERDDPVRAFARVYTDPVIINDAPMPVADLVARAAALHAAFTEHVIEIVDRMAAPGKLTVAFRHRARHTGLWRTPLGDLPPTGRTVSGLGIDVLTLDGSGRVSRIWVLADELQRIVQVRDP
ncbi:ester cyclase [Actinoplanes sp. NPDC049681]|uniref:ester cyclase n=1 Tax=Actinoplanes sp. NPDC049681 TaxID=3363905 RepID=UPI003788356A